MFEMWFLFIYGNRKVVIRKNLSVLKHTGLYKVLSLFWSIEQESKIWPPISETPLYKNQVRTSQSTQCASIIKANRWMLYWNIGAPFFKNLCDINTQCGKSAVFLVLNLAVHTQVTRLQTVSQPTIAYHLVWTTDSVINTLNK